MDFKKVQEILLKNETYADSFDEMSMSFEISRIVIQARTRRGLTQKELAEIVGTGQSSIARLESGEGLPSLSFLQKIAKELNMVLLPPLFIPVEDVQYMIISGSDNRQFKMTLSDIRKAFAHNPGKALSTSTTSAGTVSQIIGGMN